MKTGFVVGITVGAVLTSVAMSSKISHSRMYKKAKKNIKHKFEDLMEM